MRKVVSHYNVAQLNIAKMKYPIQSPEMFTFVDNLDRINSLAESSPGFIWRLMRDFTCPVCAKLFGSNIIVNMSVWSDIELLHNFVYQSSHSKIMSRRKEWFDKFDAAYSVLWWLQIDKVPTVSEANEKLLLLKNNGPTADAFTFKKVFAEPGQV